MTPTQNSTTASSTTELLASVPTQLLINGEWVDSQSGDTLTVINPANGEALTDVASGGEADAKAALDAACAVQDEWAATSARERADILRRGFELIHERADTFAKLMVLEMGKTLSGAQAEVTYGAEYLRWFSEEAVRHYGRHATVPEGNIRMMTVHKPVGPCLLLTPWNFPLAMATRKVAPAIATGCVMVLKPAKLTPLTALYFGQTMLDAGLPKGVLNIVVGESASDISSPLLADSRLRKVSFTGSTAVGKKLLEQGSQNILRASMELGGNAPFIVFDDADVDDAVECAMSAKMRNNGEVCIAANRFLVHSSVVDEFSTKLADRFKQLTVGNGMDEATDCGPLIEPDARDKVAKLVSDAIDDGAKVLVGGDAPDGAGYFYNPTVLRDVPRTADIFKEEIFGPVAAIYTFDDEDEAVEMANDTEFGLASYVYTADFQRMMRVAQQIDYGLLGYNTGAISNAAAPFGGVKHSGLGTEGGAEGIEEYSTIQYIGMPS